MRSEGWGLNLMGLVPEKEGEGEGDRDGEGGEGEEGEGEGTNFLLSPYLLVSGIST